MTVYFYYTYMGVLGAVGKLPESLFRISFPPSHPCALRLVVHIGRKNPHDTLRIPVCEPSIK